MRKLLFSLFSTIVIIVGLLPVLFVGYLSYMLNTYTFIGMGKTLIGFLIAILSIIWVTYQFKVCDLILQSAMYLFGSEE